MFKINESIYDEVTEQLEKNLIKSASNNAIKKDQKLIEALNLLNTSAEKLDLFGFEKEATALTKLIVLATINKKADEKDKVYFSLEQMKSDYTKEYNSLPNELKNKLGVMFFIDPDYTENSSYTIMAIDGGAKSYAFNTTKQSWDEMEYPLKSFASDDNMVKDHKLKSFPESLHGIPVIYLEKGDSDYNAYCPKCAKKLQDEGKNIHGHIYEEGPNRECNKCGTDLESAMGQDDYYAKNADAIDNMKNLEHPEEYKHEELERGMDDHDAYEEIMNELDERDAEDQVFI